MRISPITRLRALGAGSEKLFRLPALVPACLKSSQYEPKSVVLEHRARTTTNTVGMTYSAAPQLLKNASFQYQTPRWRNRSRFAHSANLTEDSHRTSGYSPCGGSRGKRKQRMASGEREKLIASTTGHSPSLDRELSKCKHCSSPKSLRTNLLPAAKQAYPGVLHALKRHCRSHAAQIFCKTFSSPRIGRVSSRRQA